MKKAIAFLKKHPVSILFAVLTLYLMWLIFCFSAQVGEASSALSKSTSRFLAELFVSGFSDLSNIEREAKIEELVPIIRKLAHFCVFMALGFCSAMSVFCFREEKGKSFLLKSALIPAVFCLVYATSDEFHQLFVEGRDGNVRDVLIDFGGAVLGILCCLFVFFLFLFVRHRRREKIKKYQK